VDQATAKGAKAAAKPIISFRNVSKRWGSTVAVDNVSLDIEPGEFFALLGPSGCGKTTLLRILAGLEVPTEGHVLIDGQDMRDIPPKKRAVNMVFQSYALFPHLTAAENVMEALGDVRPKERHGEAGALLQRMHLEGLEDRRPALLSGGQQQRVAVARALARRPDILLLDEPFSAVDRVTRRGLRRELMELRRELSMPVILVTHDLDDVIRLADRMCVLQGGRILQTGAVEAVMARPASPTVAELLDLSGGDGATQQMTAPPTM